MAACKKPGDHFSCIKEQTAVLLDRDLLVHLLDIDPLLSSIGVESNKDGSRNDIVGNHEDHGAYVRPPDRIEREIKGRNMGVPYPLDEQPVKKSYEYQTGKGNQRELFPAYQSPAHIVKDPY